MSDLPKATLTDWLSADHIAPFSHPDHDNTYELDGTQYVVPADVEKAGSRVEDIEGASRGDRPFPEDVFDFDDPDEVTERTAENLMTFPETIHVDSIGISPPSGAYGMSFRQGINGANHVAERLELAATRAESFPDFWDKWIGPNYAVAVEGPGLYARTVGNQSDQNGWSEKWQFGPQLGPFGSALAIRTDTVRVRDDVRNASRSIGTATQSTGTEFGSTFVLHPSEEFDLVEVETAADEAATIFEDMLADLKANHNANWEEWYGYTTVDVVTP